MARKIIIYQIFTRLYSNRITKRKENGIITENGCGKFNDIDTTTLKRIKDLGISHIWYTGIIRHATQTDYTQYGIPLNHPAVVKGKAGSPYAITDYYDVDPDLAENVQERMKEFESLITRTHKTGLKVIIDFVPNHVARQYHSICKPGHTKDLGEDDNTQQGFDPQNNFYYCPGRQLTPTFSTHVEGFGAYKEMPAKATGNDKFDASPCSNDWYETIKLNYGIDYYAGHVGYFTPIPNTWHKMLDILMFWADKGIDGFRCDMAEMVPAIFWQWAIGKVKAKYPDILFIGEVYNPNEYRNYIASGFDYLYDKVGMYDTMRAITCGYEAASAITHAWQIVDDIKEHMLYFLENHDEQRIASDFFAGNGWHGIPALVACSLMRTSPFMLYAGQEYGEHGMDREGFSGCDGRTTIFDYWNIDTLCRAATDKLSPSEEQLYEMYKKVLTIASMSESVISGEFFDLMYANLCSKYFDPVHQYAFLRKGKNEILLVVVNFSEESRHLGIVIPSHAFDYLNLPEKRFRATDLLTGEKKYLPFTRDGNVNIDICGWGARVYKMKA